MELVADKINEYLENASWIRRMFECGIQLKKDHGAENVCDFSLGNPDLPAPAAVGNGLNELLGKSGEPMAFGYMPNGGFAWAREKLAEHLSGEQGVKLGGDDVLLTCGAAGGINAFFRAVLNPGEEVLAIAPYFVEYGFYVENHGGRLRAVPAVKDSFKLDLEAIEAAISEKSRAIIVNSPNNPSGVIYSRDELKNLTALLARMSEKFGRPIWVVADEPYRFLAYDGVEVPSLLSMYPYSVVISSFSKNLSIPGERIGYVAASPLLENRAKLMAALTMTNRILGFVNPPVAGQYMMAAALNSQVDANVYAERREAMAKMLSESGVEFQKPAGAFYFFPKAPGGDDVAFVDQLQKELVLAVPGRGFGYPGYFRLAFCVDKTIIERAKKGMSRAVDAVNSRRHS